MKKKVLFFILFTTQIIAQKSFETDFYNITIPENTTANLFNSSKEEFATTEVYEFKQNNKPKYLFYLISNKLLNNDEPLNLFNYSNYLSDIGNIEVLSAEKIEVNKIRITLKYNDNETVFGVMYFSVTNNILNRFLFLLPKAELHEMFSQEINKIFLDIKYLKTEWQ